MVGLFFWSCNWRVGYWLIFLSFLLTVSPIDGYKSGCWIRICVSSSAFLRWKVLESARGSGFLGFLSPFFQPNEKEVRSLELSVLLWFLISRFSTAFFNQTGKQLVESNFLRFCGCACICLILQVLWLVCLPVRLVQEQCCCGRWDFLNSGCWHGFFKFACKFGKLILEDVLWRKSSDNWDHQHHLLGCVPLLVLSCHSQWCINWQFALKCTRPWGFTTSGRRILTDSWWCECICLDLFSAFRMLFFSAVLPPANSFLIGGRIYGEKRGRLGKIFELS